MTTITQAIDYNPTAPENFTDPAFPYDVQQFRRAICLSTRRARLFIRNNFELDSDYKIVGTKHRMVLSPKCLAVAVVLQFKLGYYPHLIDRDFIPHYSLYQADIADALDRIKARRRMRRRLAAQSDRYLQLTFDFSQC